MRPSIVILGAGYAGMMTTAKLIKKLDKNDADITLVNKHNYHYQTTMLHESAAGTLHQDRVRMHISDVIHSDRVKLLYDTVVDIKREENRVILKNGELGYDYLVVALGFESNTFGIPGLKENAFAITSIDSARKIREHIDYQFACYHGEINKEPERLAIIVGGGGLTGVEFVGELVDRIPELCREYDIDRNQVRLVNIEGAPTILPGFDKELVDYAMNYLQSKGAEFMTGTKIKECTENSVIVGDDEEVKAGTIVWTGGVRANAIVEESGFETHRGKVTVRADLRAPNDGNIFVVGDCASIIDPETSKPYPPTAQNAMQQGYTAAQNLKALIHGKRLETFTYNDKGTVASLGEKEAIGKILGNHKLYGKKASSMKKLIDDRYLLLLGGPGLMLKKGKLNLI